MLLNSEAMTEAESVSTHRHVVSIDVVIEWTSMDDREFHPRKVV